MADHPNVEKVRRGYAAFATGDMNTLNELFADDIAWHIPGRSPLAGDYKGKQEVFTLFGRLAELTGGTFKLDIHDLLGNDEHVVGIVNETATRDDRRLADQSTHVFHVRDGKVTEFWALSADPYAVDEFYA